MALAKTPTGGIVRGNPAISKGDPALSLLAGCHLKLQPGVRRLTRLAGSNVKLSASRVPIEDTIDRPKYTTSLKVWRSAEEIRRVQLQEHELTGNFSLIGGDDRFFTATPNNRLFHEVGPRGQAKIPWFDNQKFAKAIESDLLDAYGRAHEEFQCSGKAELKRFGSGEAPDEDAGFTLLRSESGDSAERELANELDSLRDTLVLEIRKRWRQRGTICDLETFQDFKSELNRDLWTGASSSHSDPLVGLMARRIPYIKSLVERLLESRSSSGNAHEVYFADMKNQALRLNASVGIAHLHALLPKTFFAANNKRTVPGKYKQYAIWIPLVKEDCRKVLAMMSKPDTKAMSDSGRLCVETFHSNSPVYSTILLKGNRPEQTPEVYAVGPPGDMLLLESGQSLHFGLVDGSPESLESLRSEEELDMLLSLSSLDIQLLAVEVDNSVSSWWESLAHV